jgi:hypothetical protein
MNMYTHIRDPYTETLILSLCLEGGKRTLSNLPFSAASGSRLLVAALLQVGDDRHRALTFLGLQSSSLAVQTLTLLYGDVMYPNRSFVAT